ncbi:MAG: DegQ family serine endoprotease [Natronospirillum sp.]|uniref:DegQ family serine endoprotease n=1 Tax=Natronospirillum sp. TaxID=2812955 RepID=UPI0025E994D3|nr:DegQ family serine endoprotease [Natronospirillum sp.]MCH8550483.1 DegQ family serine endoprotease [Natronospirillum sp.]
MRLRFAGWSPVWASVLIMMLLAGAAQAQQLPDFSELVRDQSAKVVRVEADTERQRSQQMREPEGREMPDLFRDFFGDQIPGMPQQPQPRRSQGSGFIISEDGYIVTNHHVINNATEVRVRTSDHRIFRAEIVGKDESSDIAVLKVDAEGLPAVTIGDSDALNVGEWVLAIGAPFGMDYSVTAGIVSAKGRSLGERYVPFIQSDVAINPGNSGGPLFNIEGEVVGINSQIYTRSGGFMGLSFAIPSNLVMDIVDQLQTEGRVSRGWLGIAMDDSYNDDPDLAESFGLDRAIGALVVHVYDDTPAREAGLRPGDLILEFDGREVNRYSDLAPMVGATRPGTEVDLLVLRSGEEITLPLEVGSLPHDEGMVIGQAPSDEPDMEAANPLNIIVRDLNREEAREIADGGVYVTDVLSGPAADAGLREGDIITMVHGQFVTSVEEFEQVMANLPEGRRIALRIVRDGTTRFISIGLS